MSVVLTCGSFGAIEKDFNSEFQERVLDRKDPLREQHMVLVPSGALRKHLLRSLFQSGCRSFSAVRFVSLNGLAQEILLDSLQEPDSVLDDPIYFVLALQSAARKSGLPELQAYRTARGLFNTIRDLVDGLLSPDLMEQFLDQARLDPEIQKQIANPKAMRDLQKTYAAFLEDLAAQSVINAQYASALAIDYAPEWIARKNICALHIYGFYDATPAQFELIETVARQVHSQDGAVRVYFPFSVTSNSVEHPAEYSQEFFDTLRSFVEKMGGVAQETKEEVIGASGRLEEEFFKSTVALETHPPGSPPATAVAESALQVHLLSAGSPHEEAWAVAKRIVHLVLNEGVRFDQIGVISRSMESCRAVFQHVFAENRIPHSIPRDQTLCSSTSGHFVYLLLLARQSNLNHNLVFELLCSPLLHSPFTPAGTIRELLEILFITNSDDWHRLLAIADDQKKLPDIFELAEDDSRVEQFRRAASYLARLKQQIDFIPMTGRVAEFTGALSRVVREIADPARYQEAGGLELELLLEKMTDLPLNTAFNLNEFVEIFKDYLAGTVANPYAESRPGGVMIGDIMSLRGVSFDYVFITGLNQDVWPMRTSEDPFLPDSARRLIRSTTGAGPHPKAAHDEELLLFMLALRSSKQRLYLSYQRADSDGRTKSASIYIEEAIRLLRTAVEKIPRHLEKRLTGLFLPAPHECSTLVNQFSPYEVLKEFHDLPPEYVDGTFSFAEKLNSTDHAAAAPVDGMLEDSSELWKTLSEGKLRFSYSRIKGYVRCGFSFYADRILKLQPSPFAPTEIPHDLTPLVKGRIAESVVKEAVAKLHAGESSIDDAVRNAEGKMRRKYGAYLPKVLLDYYLAQFSRAARTLLHYLQTEGYDFKFAEVPGRDYLPEMPLLDDSFGALNIYGIPDLLFYGSKRLIGEMKWGASATKETAESMFNQGELQFCFYPELERHHRQLLETADFRYFRLNIFNELGSPAELEHKLKTLGSPGKIETTLRIFGHSPTREEIATKFDELKEIGKGILRGEFKILEDPNDFFSPCTHCGFILMCRRTHSATLLRAKGETEKQEQNTEI